MSSIPKEWMNEIVPYLLIIKWAAVWYKSKTETNLVYIKSNRIESSEDVHICLLHLFHIFYT